MLLRAAGLRPEPDEGRDWLARELAHPDYHRQSLLERARDWLVELFDRLTAAASGASSLSTFAGILVAVAVVALLVYALPRVRRAPTAARRGSREVLGGVTLSAHELRRQAEQALDEGRLEEALGDAFRALVLRQVEDGMVEETIGSTAHELADRLAAQYPPFAARLTAAAGLFDAVVYGDHAAEAADARSMLALDDELRRTEPSAGLRARRRALAVPFAGGQEPPR